MIIVIICNCVNFRTAGKSIPLLNPIKVPLASCFAGMSASPADDGKSKG